MGTGYIVPAPPTVKANGSLVAHTATEAIAAADFDKIHTNTGAAGAVVLTLPDAKLVAGRSIKVQVTAAQAVSLSPNGAAEAIFLGGDGVLNKDLDIAGVIGNYADVYSDGERFHVLGYSGVLTKEA